MAHGPSIIVQFESDVFPPYCCDVLCQLDIHVPVSVPCKERPTLLLICLNAYAVLAIDMYS